MHIRTRDNAVLYSRSQILTPQKISEDQFISCDKLMYLLGTLIVSFSSINIENKMIYLRLINVTSQCYALMERAGT